MSYNFGTVATLEGYQLFYNPLWFDKTLFNDGNLFSEDDSTFIGREDIQSKVRNV